MTERGVSQTAERNDIKQKWKYLLIGGGVLLLPVFIFSRSPMLSEAYMRSVYPVIATVSSFISGIFPFSLYDLFIVVALLGFIGMILFVILRKIPVNVFLYAMVRFIVVVVAWFYLCWGVAYFRDDFYTRNGVQEVAFDKENLHKVAIRLIDNANRYYTVSHDMNKEEVHEEIEHSYLRRQQVLNLPFPNGKRRVKPMIFESLYSKMGVSGYFGPFFNEIHVNNYGLPFTYPFTMAHEMAHQYGIAPESEASLYAFIVCAGSSNPVVRYSAYVSVLGYLLRDVRRLLPDDYESLITAIRPEIIADLQRNREHWLAVRNQSLSDMQYKAYDSYLKTNQVSSGHDNYSEVVGLLISSYDVWIEE